MNNFYDWCYRVQLEKKFGSKRTITEGGSRVLKRFPPGGHMSMKTQNKRPREFWDLLDPLQRTNIYA